MRRSILLTLLGRKYQIMSLCDNSLRKGLPAQLQSNIALKLSTEVSHLLFSTTYEVAKFTDEQYTTINQSTAGCFDPKVFVNCLQALTTTVVLVLQVSFFYIH